MFSSRSEAGSRHDRRASLYSALDWYHKVRIREGFWRTTMGYFRSTSLHGFCYLAERNLHWTNKLIWTICLTAFIAWSLDLILVAWATFTMNPIYVTLNTLNYPIALVPFPGIAICPNNKLSKSATWTYAKLLSTRTNGTVSAEVFMEQLRYLGRLLDFEVDGYDNFAWLQTYLNRYDTDGIWFDTYDRMRRLSPQCEELLLHCMWEGEERPCQELFSLRSTLDGFCCTFNYVRSDVNFRDGEAAAAEPIKTRFYGVENGLQLILKVSDEDYYYPLQNNYGHSVLVFQSHDYPDMASGYLEQRIIKPNVDTMVELFPSTLIADESLRLFGPQQRNCLFRDERQSYKGFYSQSECLLNCRIRSFVALCDCIPFFIPRTSTNPMLKETQTCNLEHVQCLNKYKIKIGTYYPTTGNISGLEKELQDSIECGECLPLCNSVNYNVGTVSITLSPGAADEIAEQKWGGTVENGSAIALVKIYHAHQTSALYVQDVVSEWFNILSAYGSQIGICVGFSLLSLVELAYFYTWRLWREIKKDYNGRNKTQNIFSTKNNHLRKVYPFRVPFEMNSKPFYNKHTDRIFLR